MELLLKLPVRLASSKLPIQLELLLSSPATAPGLTSQLLSLIHAVDTKVYVPPVRKNR